MDGYRQTLLGRALADALRKVEASGAAGSVDGDAAFELFDEAVRAELAAGLRASSRRRKRLKTTAAGGQAPGDADADGDGAGEEEADAPVFTHRSLALDARLRSFNRFEDRWSLQAGVRSGGLRLDHVPLRWGVAGLETRDDDREEEGEKDEGEEEEEHKERGDRRRQQSEQAEPGEGGERVMLVKLQK